MDHAVKGIALAVLILLNSGCAKNQLLRLEAHDFSKQAIVVAESARASYLERVQANNELYDLAYAVDARCIPPRYRANLPLPPAKSNEKSEIYTLCSKQNSQLSYASFDTQLKSVDFVASYVSALAVAASEPKLASSVQFAQAAADFNVLSESMSKDGLSKEKLSSISDLLDAIEGAEADAASAETIRSAFKTHGASAHAQMISLSSDLLSVARDKHFDREALRMVREHVVRTSPAGPQGGIIRRDLMLDMHRYELDEWVQTQTFERCKKSAKNELQKYCASPSAGMMFAASQAHAELSGLIEGDVSDRQRQRRAALAYRQFIGVVGVVVGLQASF